MSTRFWLICIFFNFNCPSSKMDGMKWYLSCVCLVLKCKVDLFARWMELWLSLYNMILSYFFSNSSINLCIQTLVQKRGFFHGGFPRFLLFGVKSDVQERGVAVSTPKLLDVAVSTPKLLDVAVSTPDRLYSDNTVSYSFHLDTFDILWLYSFRLDLIDIIMRGCACIIILSYDYEMRIIEKRM